MIRISKAPLVNGLMCILLSLSLATSAQSRRVIPFDHDWSFLPGADTGTNGKVYPKIWQSVRLPHDWSIESDFSSIHPATNQGGALPGGAPLYTLDAAAQ